MLNAIASVAVALISSFSFSKIAIVDLEVPVADQAAATGVAMTFINMSIVFVNKSA
jgi:hypothetical protein